jgi:hypothetical protein
LTKLIGRSGTLMWCSVLPKLCFRDHNVDSYAAIFAAPVAERNECPWYLVDNAIRTYEHFVMIANHYRDKWRRENSHVAERARLAKALLAAAHNHSEFMKKLEDTGGYIPRND